MPHDCELMALTGLRATHAVCTLVERFIEHVLLAQEATSRLLPGSLVTGLPVLGTVAAGFPSPADEELTDTMSLDEYLIRNKDATYVLKVHGTSMRDAGYSPRRPAPGRARRPAPRRRYRHRPGGSGMDPEIFPQARRARLSRSREYRLSAHPSPGGVNHCRGRPGGHSEILAMAPPLTLQSLPRAILHIDGDAFFASCEQSRRPQLQGRPVVTGKERGIAASMSYEAKARGVRRGMRLAEIRKICPEAVILPSDYETYSLLSTRFFAIVRRYTPEVEEYSIDECFADVTGLRRPLRMSYVQIAERIKHDLDTELGFTFSVGLAPNKVVAKIASKWAKPSGLTAIPGRELHRYLAQLPVEHVWGIGHQTTALLHKHGVQTALQFAQQPEAWVQAILLEALLPDLAGAPW